MSRLLPNFILLALSFFAIGAANANDCDEKETGIYVRPSGSALTINEDPEICSLYEDVQFKILNKDISPSLFYRETEKYFPGSTIIQPGFGPKMYFPMDYDGDGIEEIFYFEYEDSSRRPGRIYIYLYETQADVDRDKAMGAYNMPWNPIRTGNLNLSKSKASFLGGFTQGVRLFHRNGKIYTYTRDGLFLLRPDQEQSRICQVNINPYLYPE